MDILCRQWSETLGRNAVPFVRLPVIGKLRTLCDGRWCVDDGEKIIYYLAGAPLGNAGYVIKAPKPVLTSSHLMIRPL